MLAGVALAGAVVAPSAAFAQVLTEGAAQRLCVNNRIVPARLAFAVVSEARATTFAATANVGGTSPNELNEGEAVEVLRGLSPAVTHPFGPHIDLARDKDAADAWKRVSDATEELADLSVGEKTVGAVTYRLLRIAGPAANDEPPYNPARLFDPNPRFVIACERTPAGPVAPTPREPASQTPQTATPRIARTPPTAPPPVWRIRGAAADLYTPSGDLSVLKPATIGFSRDEIAGTETVNFNAAVGLAFETADLSWAATPFVAWQYKDVSGAGDIDRVSPGLLLTHRLERPDIVLHSRFELSYLIDREQSSEQVKARFFLDPAFSVGGRSLFGGRVGVVGGIGFRPDLTLIADLTEVRDPGSSPALLAGGSYQGLGGDLRMLMDYQPIEGLSLLVGRRHLWLSGDLTINEAARWYGKLEYKFKTSPIGIGLTYSEGRNDDTFQAEDTTAVELTFRY